MPDEFVTKHSLNPMKSISVLSLQFQTNTTHFNPVNDDPEMGFHHSGDLLFLSLSLIKGQWVHLSCYSERSCPPPPPSLSSTTENCNEH